MAFSLKQLEMEVSSWEQCTRPEVDVLWFSGNPSIPSCLRLKAIDRVARHVCIRHPIKVWAVMAECFVDDKDVCLMDYQNRYIVLLEQLDLKRPYIIIDETR